MNISDVEKKYGVRVVDVFPGSNPNATTDQIVAEVDKSLQAIVNGDCEEIHFED